MPGLCRQARHDPTRNEAEVATIDSVIVTWRLLLPDDALLPVGIYPWLNAFLFAHDSLLEFIEFGEELQAAQDLYAQRSRSASPSLARFRGGRI